MKIKYRDFELEAYREKSLANVELIFYSIFSLDGKEFGSGFSYSGETIRDYIKEMKKSVDDWYKHPEYYDFKL